MAFWQNQARKNKILNIGNTIFPWPGEINGENAISYDVVANLGNAKMAQSQDIIQ